VMAATGGAVRVLQSFPHRIGAARICTTAWHQAAGSAAAGADVLVMPGSVHRPLPEAIRVRPTLVVGTLRVPYRALGRQRALGLHDRIVARRLPQLAGAVDVVHVWPQGARETLRVARRLGLPTVLERPNAHTAFAYAVVRDECERLGVPLPADHEHAYNAITLRHEEEEFALADRLLCPSDFVRQTFLDRGHAAERLVRHQYGYDPERFFAPAQRPGGDRPLTVLFAGVAAVRKGLHFALEAWLRSPASADGRFLIAGSFLPEYAQRLAPLLAHPSVEALGHRDDVPELMRQADALVLPSLEEGSALVTSEALASGCVPLVSDAAGALCEDGASGLVHRAGDVGALAAQLTALRADAALLARLRAGCGRRAPQLTWDRAGVRLVEVYEELAAARRQVGGRRAA
jgi:glycosyltransferase involved in cell wall biosynthesis